MYLPGRRKDNFKDGTTDYCKNIPFVLEFGGLTTRAGYAGYETPTIQIPTDYATKGNNEIDLLEFYSPRAPENSEVNSFLSQGMVNNWEQASNFIEQINKKLMQINPSETPLFLIEQALSTKDVRQKCVEAVFESMNFAALFIHKAPVLSSYVLAKETILLVDSGAYSTYVVPIVEGYVNQKGVIRSDIAGEYLTRSLGNVWKSKVEPESLNRFTNYAKLTQSMKNWGANDIIREVKSRNIKLKETRQDIIKFNHAVDTQIFELPDKQKLEILNEMFEVPELLFNPIPEENFMGLQDLIKQSIERVDAENRRELLNNIMVVGGNSMIPNLIERLQREITQLEINTSGRVKIYTTQTINERAHSSWVGGSIVASMSTFDNLLMTKRDYDEHGPILIERKVLF